MPQHDRAYPVTPYPIAPTRSGMQGVYFPRSFYALPFCTTFARPLRHGTLVARPAKAEGLEMRNGARIGVLAWFSLIALSGCGGQAAQNGTTPGGEAGSAGAVGKLLSACSFSKEVGEPAAGTKQLCSSAQTWLACRGSNGGGEGCLSDDPTQCPGPNPVVGVTFFDCQSECQPDEFGVSCGGPGPGPYPSPPSGCRGLLSGPGGGTRWCCPCGSGQSGAVLDAAAGDATDTFACGDAGTCGATSQVCEHVVGGVAPGVDYYACIPIPSACDTDVSCPCVESALRGRGAGNCSANGRELVVEILVP